MNIQVVDTTENPDGVPVSTEIWDHTVHEQGDNFFLSHTTNYYAINDCEPVVIDTDKAIKTIEYLEYMLGHGFPRLRKLIKILEDNPNFAIKAIYEP